MKIRNVWFDLMSCLGALILANSTGITIWRYLSHNDGDLTSTAFVASSLAFLAYLLCRMSLRLGNEQKQASQRSLERRVSNEFRAQLRNGK